MSISFSPPSGFQNPSVDYTSINGDGPYVTLPGAYKFGGRPRASRDTNISLETDSGRKFVYNLFTRWIYEIHFRLSPTDLDVFETFHDAVNGEVFPFFFSLSGAGAADAIQVRKEAGFEPVELTDPASGDSAFDYVLYMEQDFYTLDEDVTVVIGG